MLSDITLDGKDVLQLPVVSLRPQMLVAARVYELSVDANAVIRPPHSPFQDRIDAKLGSGSGIFTIIRKVSFLRRHDERSIEVKRTPHLLSLAAWRMIDSPAESAGIPPGSRDVKGKDKLG